MVLIFPTDRLSIIVMPDELAVGSGRNATFIAMATGVNTSRNSFHYQWRKKNGDNFPNGVSVVNTSVLTIPNVLESDEGQYYCIVTNEWSRSAWSNNVTLSIFGM